MKTGARLLQDCAVRGFETFAGRIAGAITEKGRVACRAVLLAGGAWSRQLLQQQGIAFPQLAVFSSDQRIIARPAPPASPMASLWGRGFSLGLFEDGMLDVPASEPAIHDIIPASLRLLPDFLPLSGASRRHLGLRLGRPFLDEQRWARPWRQDRPTPLEAVRTLDPRPSRRHERVVNTVEREGMSRRGAAARFGVGSRRRLTGFASTGRAAVVGVANGRAPD